MTDKSIPGSNVQEPIAEPLSNRLGQNIVVHRQALGLTQAQLAERLGVNKETLSRFERGKKTLSLVSLEKLSGILLTTTVELLGEQPKVAADDALVATSWISALASKDGAFARDLLKQCCTYLAEQQAPEDLRDKAGMISYSDVVKGLSCPREELEQNLDFVLNLIECGLTVELCNTDGYRSVTPVSTDNVYTLYQMVPAVRDAVLDRFPGCNEPEPQVIMPMVYKVKPGANPIWTKPPERKSKRAPNSIPNAFKPHLTSEAEFDNAGKIAFKDIRKALNCNAAVLKQNPDNVFSLVECGFTIHLKLDSETEKISLKDVYKLGVLVPEVSDAVEARFPDSQKQRADAAK